MRNSISQARQSKAAKRSKKQKQTQAARNAKNGTNCSSGDSLIKARVCKEIAQLKHQITTLKRQNTNLTKKIQRLQTSNQSKQWDIAIDIINARIKNIFNNVNGNNKKLIDSLYELFIKLSDCLYALGKCPPTPWQIRKQNRVEKQQNNSVTWLLEIGLWHCDRNNDAFEQLIGCLIKRVANTIHKFVQFRRQSLNLQQTNDLQQQMNVNRNQMRVLRRFLRKCLGYCVIRSEDTLIAYQNQFKLKTGSVDSLNMQLTDTSKRNNAAHVWQDTEVYHACTYEALQRLVESAFNTHRFVIQKPLLPHEFIVEIGWDKSGGGLAESVAVSVTSHYHGKYSSIATILTNDKICENYSNYRELADQWNKRAITNALLKLPNMIVLVQYCKSNGQITSKLVSTFVMTFDESSQRYWDEHDHEKLVNTPSPPITTLTIDSTKVQNAVQNEYSDNRTDQFWYEKSKIAQFKPFYVVTLPPNWNQINLCTETDFNLNYVSERSRELWFNIMHDNDINDNDNGNQNDNDVNVNTDMNSSSQESEGMQLRHLVIPNYDDDSHPSISVNNNDNESEWRASQASFLPLSDSNFDSDNASDSDVSSKNDEMKPHSVYPLSQYHFNAESGLNRMVESEWNHKCTHAAASSIQGCHIYKLLFDDVVNNDMNVNLPLSNTEKIKTNIDIECLFDNMHGLQYFWLNNVNVPKPHNVFQDKVVMFGLICNDLMIGLLTVLIKGNIYDSNASTQFRDSKCEIHQRCINHNPPNVENALWEIRLNDQFVCKNDDLSFLSKIGKTQVDYNSDELHDITYFSVELDTYLQYDNKGKNLSAGMSTNSATHPCSICYVDRDTIQSWPTPSDCSFTSRTTAKMIELAIMKPDDKTHNMGCVNAPIYDVPVHKRGPTTLHEHEGIYCVMINTMRDCIISLTNADDPMQQLEQDADEVAQLYDEITRLQDLLETVSPNYDREFVNKVAEHQAALAEKKREYIHKKQNLEYEMNQCDSNNILCKFYKILSNHDVNLFYCMRGSLKGVMCGRINDARFELIDLLTSIDVAVGNVWSQLFCNIAYIYDMLKHKGSNLWTQFDMASIKNAYLDFYYQLLFVVCQWKETGHIGNKAHILVHDIEHAFKKHRSPAFEDDQRFENFNQLVKLIRGLYSKYHGRDQLLHMANRMNNRSLSCG